MYAGLNFHPVYVLRGASNNQSIFPTFSSIRTEQRRGRHEPTMLPNLPAGRTDFDGFCGRIPKSNFPRLYSLWSQQLCKLSRRIIKLQPPGTSSTVDFRIRSYITLEPTDQTYQKQISTCNCGKRIFSR
jgi:hypothetical protein